MQWIVSSYCTLSLSSQFTESIILPSCARAKNTQHRMLTVKALSVLHKLQKTAHTRTHAHYTHTTDTTYTPQTLHTYTHTHTHTHTTDTTHTHTHTTDTTHRTCTHTHTHTLQYAVSNHCSDPLFSNQSHIPLSLLQQPVTSSFSPPTATSHIFL